LLGSNKPAAQTHVGNSKRFFRRKPPRLRALTLTRMRIIITCQQQIPQVEVAMPTRARVHINVDQLRPVVRMRNRKPEFFVRLAYRRCSRMFTVVDVPAWLQPQTQSFVQVQHPRHDAPPRWPTTSHDEYQHVR